LLASSQESKTVPVTLQFIYLFILLLVLDFKFYLFTTGIFISTVVCIVHDLLRTAAGPITRSENNYKNNDDVIFLAAIIDDVRVKLANCVSNF
jgi:hypothetical protein